MNTTRILLTHPKARPALRDPNHYQIRAVKGIVIHWTANEAPTANALNNRKYFNQGTRFASAHYIVEDHMVLQCLPDTEVGYHCGDKPEGKYRPVGKEMIARTVLTPNFFTIGIEMCVNKGNNWDTTVQQTAHLAASLLYRYGLSTTHLYRHFDITGKACPRPLLEAEDWAAFKAKVAASLRQLMALNYLIGEVSCPDPLNVRVGPGAGQLIEHTLLQHERIIVLEEKEGWYRIGENQWVNSKFINFPNIAA